MWVIHRGIAEGTCGTSALRNPHTNGERVAFNPETGKTTRELKDEIGEQLVAWHPDIEPAETGDEPTESGGESTEDDAPDDEPADE